MQYHKALCSNGHTENRFDDLQSAADKAPAQDALVKNSLHLIEEQVVALPPAHHRMPVSTTRVPVSAPASWDRTRSAAQHTVRTECQRQPLK